MIRVSFDIKCKNGQVTVKPKIYCKGTGTQLEDNVDELLTAMYAAGLTNNIIKASAALKNGITDQIKYMIPEQVPIAIKNMVADKGFDLEDIYRDSGNPFASK